MNGFAAFQEDWARANAEGRTLALIIEQAALSLAQRTALCNGGGSCLPLLYQPEVVQLRSEGPALLEVTGQPFEHFASLHEMLGTSALAGWLSSPLPVERLATHLGDAMACQDSNGTALLIRSHAGHVLPILHQQAGQPWHHWLFDPLDYWWGDTQEAWRRFAGGSSSEVPAYHPIQLDEPMARRLQHHALAHALLAQGQAMGLGACPSDCHGERLEQIEQWLDMAQEQGLEQPNDQASFVLHSLAASAPLHHRPDWPAILRQVNEAGSTLENALAARSD